VEESKTVTENKLDTYQYKNDDSAIDRI